MPMLLVTIAVLLLASGPAFAQAPTCAGHLVSITRDGAVAAGSKDALRDALHRGAPLRVGWSLDFENDGKPDLTHWADAAFLTEWQGEIFAQIRDIQRQSPRAGAPRVEMPAKEQRWTGLLGTTGVLTGHFSDGAAAPEVRVSSTWCLASCPPPEWRLVYRHDADGKALAGSKDVLFDAVRRASPIRLAWGMRADAGNVVSVEHVAEPVFVTIMNGKELFVQLPEHIAQASYADPAQARFDTPSVMWRGMMGTDGTFDAVYVDRATGKEVQRLPQRAGVAWFALAPEAACATAPLQLADPGGVRRRAP